MLSNSFISSSWKLGIGIKGISVKQKDGGRKKGHRRLNAIDDARVTSTPLLNPLITNLKTSFIGMPSKPGRTRFPVSYLS